MRASERVMSFPLTEISGCTFIPGTLRGESKFRMRLDRATKTTGAPKFIECVRYRDTVRNRSAGPISDQCSDVSPGHTLHRHLRFACLYIQYLYKLF